MRNETFFGVAINIHEHQHTSKHNRLVVGKIADCFEPMRRRLLWLDVTHI